MSDTPDSVSQEPSPANVPVSWNQLAPLFVVTACLVAASAGWYLLRELGSLFRPLALAILLTYVIIPIHLRLRTRISATASGILIVGGTVTMLYIVAALSYASILEFNADLPRITARAQAAIDGARKFAADHLPSRLIGSVEDAEAEKAWIEGARTALRNLLNVAAGAAAEAFVVGLYLIFILLEIRRIPERIQHGFGADRSGRILEAIRGVNESMVGYLRAKVVSSLILAIPTMTLLWLFGVKFALMWGLLTFFGNFVPYVGGLVAFAFPAALAFLDLQPVGRPITLVVLLLTIQTIINNFIEPRLTAKAVDLSALVVMIGLSFWGLCWGVTGMVLAVPLTALLKIILKHTMVTKPFAELLSE